MGIVRLGRQDWRWIFSTVVFDDPQYVQVHSNSKEGRERLACSKLRSSDSTCQLCQNIQGYSKYRNDKKKRLLVLVRAVGR